MSEESTPTPMDEIRALRRRIAELEEASNSGRERRRETDDALPDDLQLLAELADGGEEPSEEALGRLIEDYGAEAVAQAMRDRPTAEADATVAPPSGEPAMSHDHDPIPFTPPPTPAGGLATGGPGAWWRGRTGWLAAAAVLALAAGVGLAYFGTLPHTPQGPGAADSTDGALAIHWPAAGTFGEGDGSVWGGVLPALPEEMPDFGAATGTLGAGGPSAFQRWRTATVIVRTENGFGSGAFVSPDGWIVTNYHVVASAAQRVSLTGDAARVQIVTARVESDRVKPNPPRSATLYRADAQHDLALLKLDDVAEDEAGFAYFELGEGVQDGDDCYVVGSQSGGPAWWIRGGTVSQRFDFPEDLSQVAAGLADSGEMSSRARATVLVSDAQVSPGDSGGPLLNEDGELIGLTFATSANESAGSVGWHIALRHLETFLAAWPTEPEAVPFDAWDAGLPRSVKLVPERVDTDRDGRADVLRYRFMRPGPRGREAGPLAVVLYLDFAQRSDASADGVSQVPRGLWGMEGRGGFHADVFVLTRADGLTAVGYLGEGGLIDEIRLGQSGQSTAEVVWRRGGERGWRASRPTGSVPLFDTERLGRENMSRIAALTGQVVSPSGRGPGADPGRGPGWGPSSLKYVPVFLI
ncbi:MAG: serine protease, partial [Planctomycetota bacterium]